MKQSNDSDKSKFVEGLGQVYKRDSARPKKNSKRANPKAKRPKRLGL